MEETPDGSPAILVHVKMRVNRAGVRRAKGQALRIHGAPRISGHVHHLSPKHGSAHDCALTGLLIVTRISDRARRVQYGYLTTTRYVY